MIIHTVSPGETLYSIAGQYGVTVYSLMVYNGLTGGQPLVPGQTLVVLYAARVHTVAPGDTLASIAARHSLTVQALLRNNPQLRGNSGISPGQELVLAFTEPRRGTIQVNSYAYPFIDRQLLRETVFYLSALAPFTYGITSNGGLVPLEDEQLLATAGEYGVSSLMHLSTLTESGSFDTSRAAALLRSQTAREALTANIMTTMEEKDYAGLDVDFEYISAEDAPLYANFVAQLRQALAPRGWPVIVALAPKTSADQPGLLYQGHDYAALAQAADAVLLMTYEWGYTYGPPLAVAPLPSVRRVLDYAVTEMSPEKILLGIPNYGYDWTLPYVRGETRAQSIPNAYALELAAKYGAEIQFDQNYLTPYFNYTDQNGRIHEVWFEDGRSIKAKLELIAEYGFLGAGYWNMMRPFQQGWSILNAMYDISDQGVGRLAEE